jgi:hypothetical protein
MAGRFLYFYIAYIRGYVGQFRINVAFTQHSSAIIESIIRERRMALLEEVFRLSGVPTYTFVEPPRYDAIKVSIRTPGRCMIIEGPSGIGKTTSITKIIDELGKKNEVISLSARRPKDLDFINSLPSIQDIGMVIVDDFHRLPDETKAALSDFMKILADEGDPKSKLILIGINKAGTQLVKFAHDLGMRVDVFKLEANPIEKVEQLISLGEQALNISIQEKRKLAERAQGSFHITQLLAHSICVDSGVTETQSAARKIETSVDSVVENVMIDLGRQFSEATLTFARGSKLRKEGRAPYLHILKWLSESDEWSLDLSEAVRRHPDQRGSVGQVLEKGHLESLLRDKANILEAHFHFEPSTSVLSVEDPKLIFYLKNIVWRAFVRRAGYKTDYFQGQYDFALSFAGADRDIAKRLAELLGEREVAVFYDYDEQHRIVSRNIEDYLAPIYRSEARYVLPLLSTQYPTRIWTKFESDQFKERFGEGAVIPIRFSNVQEGYFSETAKYGGLSFSPLSDHETQLKQIVETLCRRLIEDKEQSDSEDEIEDQE